MNFIVAKDLRERLQRGEHIVLLDVREIEELTGPLGHLPEIKHVPLGDLPVRISELNDHKAGPIVTICKMGGRATRAAEFLQQAGFKNICVLEGGMNGWQESGLPVESARV